MKFEIFVETVKRSEIFYSAFSIEEIGQWLILQCQFMLSQIVESASQTAITYVFYFQANVVDISRVSNFL